MALNPLKLCDASRVLKPIPGTIIFASYRTRDELPLRWQQFGYCPRCRRRMRLMQSGGLWPHHARTWASERRVVR